MYYYDFISIEVGDVGVCVVPLEELYFVCVLGGEYPVIGEDGAFRGNLGVRVEICNGGVSDKQGNAIQLMGKNLPIPQKQSDNVLLSQPY